MDQNEIENITDAVQTGLWTIRDVYTNPEAIKAFLSQGIPAPKILETIDGITTMAPDLFQDGDVLKISAQIKRLGAEE